MAGYLKPILNIFFPLYSSIVCMSMLLTVHPEFFPYLVNSAMLSIVQNPAALGTSTYRH